MADLVITAATVAKGTGAVLNQQYLAGETVTAGMTVYLKSADSRWYKAKCAGTAEEATVGGVTLHASLAGQPLAVQTAGTMNIGAAGVVGSFYYISTTYGGLCTFADIVGVSTSRVSQVGYISLASNMVVAPLLTGVLVP